VVNQLQHAKRLDDVVIATSNLSKDDAIEEFSREGGILCARGSEKDVLDRYWRAADEAMADYVVRITADCPLICPTVVDATIASHFASGRDYTMNDVPGTFPRGYDAEVFSREVLDKTHKAARKAGEREHVTYYIYTHPEEFSVNVFRDAAFPRFPTERLCVDTREDFKVVRSVIENVHEEKRYMHHLRVLEFLASNPAIAALNAGVRQKAAAAGGGGT
jgi:spore coat polysaccharide biosynthesis protein SpsF